MVIGEPYCGKLVGILQWMHVYNQEFIICHCTSETTVDDLLGSIQPTESKEQPFEWVDGPVTKALTSGLALVLKGLHHTDSAVLESMNGILECGKKRKLTINGKVREVHHDFFAIGVASNEKDLPFTEAFSSRFLSFQFETFIDHVDVAEMMSQKTICKNININKLSSLKCDENNNYRIGQVEFVFNCIQNLSDSQQIDDQQLETLIESLIDLKLSKEIDPFYFKLAVQGIKIDEKKQGFSNPPSRQKALDIIMFAIKCKLVTIFEGIPGIGKTKIIKTAAEALFQGDNKQLIEFNFNKNTTINDLMGRFEPQIQGKASTCQFMKGPLFIAIEQGRMILFDEFNLASPELLGILSYLFSYPKSYKDPISQKTLKLHRDFHIFCTQNPSNYPGRNALPTSIINRTLKIILPNYNQEELINILKTRCSKRCTETGIVVKIEMKAYILMTDILQGQGTKDITLRHTIKLFNRAFHFIEESGKSQTQVVTLLANVLFPEYVKQQYLIKKISYRIELENQKWTFKLIDNAISIPISISMISRQNDLQNQENILKRLQTVPLSYQGAICKIAFCIFFKEPILLEGPTGYKSFCVDMISKMLHFDHNCNLSTIFCSPLSEASDIVGSVEPHNYSSYRDHVNAIKRRFSLSLQSEMLDHATKYNPEAQPKKYSNLSVSSSSYLNRVIANLKSGNDQFFPYCERGIMINVRFGGIAFLKNINIPDQAIIEGLNSLTELEPSFTLDGKQVSIHPQFFIIGSIHKPITSFPSNALYSRFTLINFEKVDMLNPLNRLSQETESLIYDYIKQLKYDSSIYPLVKSTLEMMFQSLKAISTKKFESLTTRQLFYLLDYLKLELEHFTQDPITKKLMIGFQILFLDQLDPLKQSQFKMMKPDHTLFFNQLQEQCNIDKITSLFEKKGNQIVMKYQNLIVKTSKTELTNLLPGNYSITSSMVRNLFRIVCSTYTNQVLCLVGPPGVGKTAIAEVASFVIGKKFVRICCSKNLSIEDLYGQFVPKLEGNGEKMTFSFQEGILADAIKTNAVFLFDEINLLQPDVLGTLIQLFDCKTEIIIKDSVIKKQDVVFLAAMNPPSVGGGRQDLQESLQGYFSFVNLGPFDSSEYKKIITTQYQNQLAQISFQCAMDLHLNKASAVNYNLRNVQNLSAIQKNLMDQQQIDQKSASSSYLEALSFVMIYSDCFKDKQMRQRYQDIILEQYKQFNPKTWNQRIVDIKLMGEQVHFIVTMPGGSNEIKIKVQRFPNKVASIHNIPYIHTPYFNQRIEKLCLAFQSRRFVLLEGPACSGKTSSIKELARLMNIPYIEIFLNEDIDESDLLGGFGCINSRVVQKSLLERVCQQFEVICSKHGLVIPKDLNFATIAQTLEHIKTTPEAIRLLESLNQLKKIGEKLDSDETDDTKFKFYDGVLKLSILNGCLVILENVDQIRQEVIERFNSLGEANGRLLIYENGKTTEIQPHPNFRLFCTSNPERIGSKVISDPFYNRCIKIRYNSIEEEIKNKNPLIDQHITQLAAQYKNDQMLGNIQGILDMSKDLLVKEMKAGSGLKLTQRALCNIYQHINSGNQEAVDLILSEQQTQFKIDNANDLFNIGFNDLQKRIYTEPNKNKQQQPRLQEAQDFHLIAILTSVGVQKRHINSIQSESKIYVAKLPKQQRTQPFIVNNCIQLQFKNVAQQFGQVSEATLDVTESPDQSVILKGQYHLFQTIPMTFRLSFLDENLIMTGDNDPKQKFDPKTLYQICANSKVSKAEIIKTIQNFKLFTLNQEEFKINSLKISFGMTEDAYGILYETAKNVPVNILKGSLSLTNLYFMLIQDKNGMNVYATADIKIFEQKLASFTDINLKELGSPVNNQINIKQINSQENSISINLQELFRTKMEGFDYLFQGVYFKNSEWALQIKVTSPPRFDYSISMKDQSKAIICGLDFIHLHNSTIYMKLSSVSPKLQLEMKTKVYIKVNNTVYYLCDVSLETSSVKPKFEFKLYQGQAMGPVQHEEQKGGEVVFLRDKFKYFREERKPVQIKKEQIQDYQQTSLMETLALLVKDRLKGYSFFQSIKYIELVNLTLYIDEIPKKSTLEIEVLFKNLKYTAQPFGKQMDVIEFKNTTFKMFFDKLNIKGTIQLFAKIDIAFEATIPFGSTEISFKVVAGQKLLSGLSNMVDSALSPINELSFLRGLNFFKDLNLGFNESIIHMNREGKFGINMMGDLSMGNLSSWKPFSLDVIELKEVKFSLIKALNESKYVMTAGGGLSFFGYEFPKIHIKIDYSVKPIIKMGLEKDNQTLDKPIDVFGFLKKALKLPQTSNFSTKLQLKDISNFDVGLTQDYELHTKFVIAKDFKIFDFININDISMQIDGRLAKADSELKIGVNIKTTICNEYDFELHIKVELLKNSRLQIAGAFKQRQEGQTADLGKFINTLLRKIGINNDYAFLSVPFQEITTNIEIDQSPEKSNHIEIQYSNKKDTVWRPFPSCDFVSISGLSAGLFYDSKGKNFMSKFNGSYVRGVLAIDSLRVLLQLPLEVGFFPEDGHKWKIFYINDGKTKDVVIQLKVLFNQIKSAINLDAGFDIDLIMKEFELNKEYLKIILFTKGKQTLLNIMDVIKIDIEDVNLDFKYHFKQKPKYWKEHFEITCEMMIYFKDLPFPKAKLTFPGIEKTWKLEIEKQRLQFSFADILKLFNRDMSLPKQFSQIKFDWIELVVEWYKSNDENKCKVFKLTLYTDVVIRIFKKQLELRDISLRISKLEGKELELELFATLVITGTSIPLVYKIKVKKFEILQNNTKSIHLGVSNIASIFNHESDEYKNFQVEIINFQLDLEAKLLNIGGIIAGNFKLAIYASRQKKQNQFIAALQTKDCKLKVINDIYKALKLKVSIVLIVSSKLEEDKHEAKMAILNIALNGLTTVIRDKDVSRPLELYNDDKKLESIGLTPKKWQNPFYVANINITTKGGIWKFFGLENKSINGTIIYNSELKKTKVYAEIPFIEDVRRQIAICTDKIKFNICLTDPIEASLRIKFNLSLPRGKNPDAQIVFIGELRAKKTQIVATLRTKGEWDMPFGIKYLTIGEIKAELGMNLAPPSTDIQLGGSFRYGRDKNAQLIVRGQFKVTSSATQGKPGITELFIWIQNYELLNIIEDIIDVKFPSVVKTIGNIIFPKVENFLLLVKRSLQQKMEIPDEFNYISKGFNLKEKLSKIENTCMLFIADYRLFNTFDVSVFFFKAIQNCEIKAHFILQPVKILGDFIQIGGFDSLNDPLTTIVDINPEQNVFEIGFSAQIVICKIVEAKAKLQIDADGFIFEAKIKLWAFWFGLQLGIGKQRGIQFSISFGLSIPEGDITNDTEKQIEKDKEYEDEKLKRQIREAEEKRKKDEGPWDWFHRIWRGIKEAFESLWNLIKKGFDWILKKIRSAFSIHEITVGGGISCERAHAFLKYDITFANKRYSESPSIGIDFGENQITKILAMLFKKLGIDWGKSKGGGGTPDPNDQTVQDFNKVNDKFNAEVGDSKDPYNESNPPPKNETNTLLEEIKEFEKKLIEGELLIQEMAKPQDKKDEDNKNVEKGKVVKPNLVVEILEQGTGPVCPLGAEVKIAFTYTFKDEKDQVIKSKVDLGEPQKFTLGKGHMVRGLETAITKQFQKGTKAIVTCSGPETLVDGEKGKQENVTMIFEVKLIDFGSQKEGIELPINQYKQQTNDKIGQQPNSVQVESKDPQKPEKEALKIPQPPPRTEPQPISQSQHIFQPSQIPQSPTNTKPQSISQQQPISQPPPITEPQPNTQQQQQQNPQSQPIPPPYSIQHPQQLQNNKNQPEPQISQPDDRDQDNPSQDQKQSDQNENNEPGNDQPLDNERDEIMEQFFEQSDSEEFINQGPRRRGVALRVKKDQQPKDQSEIPSSGEYTKLLFVIDPNQQPPQNSSMMSQENSDPSPQPKKIAPTKINQDINQFFAICSIIKSNVQLYQACIQSQKQKIYLQQSHNKINFSPLLKQKARILIDMSSYEVIRANIEIIVSVLCSLTMAQIEFEIIRTGDRSIIGKPSLIKRLTNQFEPLVLVNLIPSLCGQDMIYSEDIDEEVCIDYFNTHTKINEESTVDWILYFSQVAPLDFKNPLMSQLKTNNTSFQIAWCVLSLKQGPKFFIKDSSQSSNVDSIEQILARLTSINTCQDKHYNLDDSLPKLSDGLFRSIASNLKTIKEANKSIDIQFFNVPQESQQEYNSFSQEDLPVIQIPLPDLSQITEESLINASSCFDQMKSMLANEIEQCIESFAVTMSNKFTRFSNSQRGKVLSIPGLIKWFTTNGSSKDIWLQKNKGASYSMSVSIVLDFSTASSLNLKEHIAALAIILIATLERFKISNSCISFNETCTLIKSTSETSWNDFHKLLLLSQLNDNQQSIIIQSGNEIDALFCGLDQLKKDTKVSHTDPKYLILLSSGGHSSYTTSNMNALKQRMAAANVSFHNFILGQFISQGMKSQWPNTVALNHYSQAQKVVSTIFLQSKEEELCSENDSKRRLLDIFPGGQQISDTKITQNIEGYTPYFSANLDYEVEYVDEEKKEQDRQKSEVKRKDDQRRLEEQRIKDEQRKREAVIKADRFFQDLQDQADQERIRQQKIKDEEEHRKSMEEHRKKEEAKKKEDLRQQKEAEKKQAQDTKNQQKIYEKRRKEDERQQKEDDKEKECIRMEEEIRQREEDRKQERIKWLSSSDYITNSKGYYKSQIESWYGAVPLIMVCPNIFNNGNNCQNKKKKWVCKTCMEYKQLSKKNNKFILHCKCDDQELTSAKFKCSDPRHGAKEVDVSGCLPQMIKGDLIELPYPEILYHGYNHKFDVYPYNYWKQETDKGACFVSGYGGNPCTNSTFISARYMDFINSFGRVGSDFQIQEFRCNGHYQQINQHRDENIEDTKLPY